MKLLLNIKQLKKTINKESSLGFVPTMGALHKGHLSLIKKSQKLCKKTIVSIFINRSQFNKKNDYLNYPRNHKNDLKILKKTKIDYLFMPNENDIFGIKRKKKIKLDNFHKLLCGKFRPGHFYGVVDVVDRFLSIIKPSFIFLGEKDLQQLILIEKYIYNKHKVKVVICKTIRDKNGLALSSRNFLLNNKEKKIGSKVYKLLYKEKKQFKNDKKKYMSNKLKKKILNFGVKKIDYLEYMNIKNITKSSEKKYKLFIAYYLRSVRLIDNI